MTRLTFTLCLIFSFSISHSQTLQKSTAGTYTRYLDQQGFVRNAGQFTDEKNNRVKDVFYGTHIGTCGIFITNKGLSYINYKITGKKLKAIPGKNKNDSVPDYKYNIERVDVSLLHASIRLENTTEVKAKSSVSYNYYTSSHNAGNTGLHICEKIIFNNVYPGIDWSVELLTDNTGKTKLKYSFIVRPGGDAGKIKLRYSKNALLKLNEAGELIAQTALTTFTEKTPVSFLQKTQASVNVRYKRKGQTVSFEGINQIFNETLIIDPDVFWATYLPSTLPDVLDQTIMGADVATDSDANIFVTLSTMTKIPFITVDPGNGAFYQDYSSVDNGAMIIMKFNPKGVLLWSTYFAGKAQSQGNIMTIDKSGNVYALGKVTSRMYTDDTVTNYIPLKNKGGFFDIHPKDNFITEFDNNGRLLWCSFIGGYDTYIEDITTDDENNMYITGNAVEDAAFPVADPGNSAYMQGSPQYGHLIFISQFNSSSKLLWSTHIDGNADDLNAKIEIDNKGNIYVGANVRSSVYPLKDAGGYFNSNMWGFTVTRFNKDRQITWCTALPGAFSFADIAVDDSCNLYVINNLGTLRKFNEKTELVWTQQYIQTKSYYFQRLLYDRANNVLHILGQMNSVEYDFPTKNTECKGSFFFNGQNGQFLSATGPIFMTYTTDGNLQYCTLADWIPNYYDYSNFVVDSNGDLVYLFKYLPVPILIPALTDPGNGAYYKPFIDSNSSTPFLMKLTASELTVDSTVTLSANCDSNNIVNLKVLCGKAPFTYAWSNGADSSTVKVPAGNYSVTVTDANFLTKRFDFHIPKAPGSVNSFQADITGTHCGKKDGSLTINNIAGGKAPFTFSLNSGVYASTPAFNNIDSGNYVVSVKDATGCFTIDTFLIKNIPGPSALDAMVTTASCNKSDGTISIDSIAGGVAPYLYSINNSAYVTESIFNNLPATAVAISVKDAFGCTFSDSVLITQALRPDSANIITFPDHCSSSRGAINVNNIYGGNGPFDISLDNNSYASKTIINNLLSGPYTLYIRDAKNCLLEQQVNIDNIGGPDSTYYQKHDAICGAITGSLQIDSVRNGNAPYLFSVDNQDYHANLAFSQIQAGSHTLTVKDNFGCRATEAFNIKYVKQYGINIVPYDTSVCYGQQIPFSLEFENSGDIKKIQWYTGESTSSVLLSPLQSTPVTVMVTDDNDCIIKDTSYAVVAACNSLDKCVGIPTAFTPNGDGINDKIGPLANGCQIKDLLFRVYNRFGQQVFSTTDLSKKWDGKINGVEQPQGVYVYICSFNSNGNERSQVKGNFILVR